MIIVPRPAVDASVVEWAVYWRARGDAGRTGDTFIAAHLARAVERAWSTNTPLPNEIVGLAITYTDETRALDLPEPELVT